ncbi:unnamed protein product [Boreogadus saida]
MFKVKKIPVKEPIYLLRIVEIIHREVKGQWEDKTTVPYKVIHSAPNLAAAYADVSIQGCNQVSACRCLRINGAEIQKTWRSQGGTCEFADLMGAEQVNWDRVDTLPPSVDLHPVKPAPEADGTQSMVLLGSTCAQQEESWPWLIRAGGVALTSLDVIGVIAVHFSTP